MARRQPDEAGEGPGMWAIIRKTYEPYDSYVPTHTVGLYALEADADDYLKGWEEKRQIALEHQNSQDGSDVVLSKKWVPVLDGAEKETFHVLYYTETYFDVENDIRIIEDVKPVVFSGRELAQHREASPEYRLAWENQDKAVELSTGLFSEVYPDVRHDGDGEILEHLYENFLSFSPSTVILYPVKDEVTAS